MYDHIEIGDSNLVPLKDGWWYHTTLRSYVSPEGVFFNSLPKDEDDEVSE